MIEFAAGIMVGGSIGAVIMGALLAQVRTAPGAGRATALQAHAPLQAPQQVATRAARRPSVGLPVLLRTQLAAASSQLH